MIAGEKVDVKPGNAMPLSSMPIGTIIYNVELKPGKGGQIARSAGGFVQLVGRDAGWAILKLSSGRNPGGCVPIAWPVLAPVSNPDHGNTVDSKAWPDPLEGHTANGSRHHHEPGRSPQRWPHQWR